jgi:hypothetical protein
LIMESGLFSCAIIPRPSRQTPARAAPVGAANDFGDLLIEQHGDEMVKPKEEQGASVVDRLLARRRRRGRRRSHSRSPAPMVGKNNRKNAAPVIRSMIERRWASQQNRTDATWPSAPEPCPLGGGRGPNASAAMIESSRCPRPQEAKQNQLQDILRQSQRSDPTAMMAYAEAIGLVMAVNIPTRPHTTPKPMPAI